MAAKILVVDDDPNVQRLLQYTLKQEGYDVDRGARRRRGIPAVGRRGAGPDPARRHAAQARRLPGRDQDPGRGGQRQPRPDHHAHRRARGRAEGPRPARRRRRLPHQAVPPGRAAGPDQEPARPLRAAKEALLARPPLGRVLAFYGAKGGVGTTTIAINAAIALHRELGRKVGLVDGNLQFGDHRVFLDLGLDRKSIVDVVSAPTIDADLIRQVMVKHDSGVDLLLAPPSPETAELVRPEHLPFIAEQLRVAVRLHAHRHRQAARRRQPRHLRGGRDGVRGDDRRPVVPQERPPDPRDDGPPRLSRRARSSSSSTARTRSPASTSRTPRARCKRTIEHQVVNEYRGAISALNSGAPFMFTKADSALGASLLQFARAVDKPVAAAAAARTPVPRVRQVPR